MKAKINDSTHKWRTSVMSDEVPKLKRASSDYKSGSKSSNSDSDSLGKTTLKVSKKGSSAILNWSTVSGAESYNIYRKSGSGSWKKISTVSKTTYTDKNLKAGTYSYRIQATSGSKTGKDSKAKTIKIK
jgi:fibronectin type 3 domain-containing protein